MDSIDVMRHRRECEAKMVLNMPTAQARLSHLALIQEARGIPARLDLEETMQRIIDAEAQTILNLSDKATRRAHLDAIENTRGRLIRQDLEAAMLKLWRLRLTK